MEGKNEELDQGQQGPGQTLGQELREPRETDYLISNSSRPASQNRRRPYYYSPYGLQDEAVNASSINSTSIDNWSERANYSRYLYYSRLRRQALGPENDLLLIPPHAIPIGFYYPPFTKTSDGKQSSIVTIFTVWNTMTGTSLLSMPWAIDRAGLIPAVILLVGMAAISFYTAYRILEVYENNVSSKIQDFAVLCKRLLGRWAQILAIIFSVLTLLGAAIVYWVLMSNFIYHTVDIIHLAVISDVSPFSSNESDIYCPVENSTLLVEEEIETDWFHEIWSLNLSVPLFLIILIGPIICIGSPTFLAKFNSLGTLSVIYILVFVFVKLGKHGFNVSLSDISSPSYTPLYRPNFPALAGMLSLSYFIHNCIVTIMKNNRNPSQNKRDLGISFLFVALTYFLIGGLFYLTFPLDKACIQDNFLNNFRPFDAWTFVARIFLFFQILTVYPLIVYILRVQVTYSIFKQEPTFLQTVGSNLVIIAICVSFAIWFPQIGNLLRFTGAICGLVFCFILPICLYLIWQKNLNSLSNLNIFLHTILFLLGFSNFIAQFIVSP